MDIQQYERSALALEILQLFPSSIQESLITDSNFRTTYGLIADAQISFGDDGVSYQRSKLFDGVREILTTRSGQPTLMDDADQEWSLEIVETANVRRVALSQGKRRLLLPDFSALSPNKAERINGFDQKANDVHLPEQVATVWRKILASRSLTDDEADALQKDIEATPIQTSTLIGSGIEKGTCHFVTFVPRSERYFVRLVGHYQQSRNITEYSQAGAREHIYNLMSWRAYDGFLLSLLLSSHGSITSVIDTDQLEEKELVQAYEWLHTKGDRISQIGAIEIGLSILDKRPKIEPYVQGMIEQIRDEKTDDVQGRTYLLSALIILVDGELSRTNVLSGKPPFWRRLASIAQAALIEKRIIESHVDSAEFTKWAVHVRGQLFYL